MGTVTSSYVYASLNVKNLVCSSDNRSCPHIDDKINKEQYLNYARLVAYDFNFAKSFNLDDDTDLNVFLDILTDDCPEVLIYPREDFLTKAYCKEYLKILCQI